MTEEEVLELIKDIEPIYTSQSLHVYEERYEVEGKKITIYYPVFSDGMMIEVNGNEI
jgi:hypothetical protein